MIRTAIFSHWSVPNYLNRFCGFNNRRDFESSFALSAYCAKHWFKNLILYTDHQGVKDLARVLPLFDQVKLDLQELHDNNVPSSLWAYPKILAYSKEFEPFLHIDNDVFLWEKLPLEFLYQGLVCQSIEYKMPIYKFCFERILKSPIRSSFSPYFSFYKKFLWMCGMYRKKTNNPVLTPNFGIFGGTDIDFIHYYCRRVLKILQDSSNFLYFQKHDMGDTFNAVYEQWLFAHVAFKKNKIIVPLLEPPPGYRICNEIDLKKGEAYIYKGSNNIKYTHLVGGSKRDPYLAAKVRTKATQLLPESISKYL